MSASFTLTATFHVHTVSGEDAGGVDTYTVTDLPVDGCVFAPGGSVETLGGRDTVVDQPSLYCPAAAASVQAIDTVSVPGFGDFEVDGRPSVYPPNPFTGWVPDQSVVIRLRAVAG